MDTTGQLSASGKAVQMQNWVDRVRKVLPAKISAISNKIELRTEFSGACAAEYALQAVSQLCSSPPTVSCLSMGDWSCASRRVGELNCPDTCRFGDIMGLAPADLQKKLESEVMEKVHCLQRFCCHCCSCCWFQLSLIDDCVVWILFVMTCR